MLKLRPLCYKESWPRDVFILGKWRFCIKMSVFDYRWLMQHRNSNYKRIFCKLSCWTQRSELRFVATWNFERLKVFSVRWFMFIYVTHSEASFRLINGRVPPNVCLTSRVGRSSLFELLQLLITSLPMPANNFDLYSYAWHIFAARVSSLFVCRQPPR